MKTSSCKGCGEPVIWTVTDRGARAPMDAEPSSEGTFSLREEGSDVIATYVRKGSHPELHTSHFATCADAASFRRKR